MPPDYDIDVPHDFVRGVPTSYTTLLSLGSIGLVKLEIIAFVISVPIPTPIPNAEVLMLRFTNGRKVV